MIFTDYHCWKLNTEVRLLYEAAALHGLPRVVEPANDWGGCTAGTAEAHH